MAAVPRGSDRVPAPGGQAAPLESVPALPVLATVGEERQEKAMSAHLHQSLGGFAAEVHPESLNGAKETQSNV